MRAVNSKFDSINKKAIKSVFFGALVGTLITIILTIICSLVIVSTGKLPDGALEYISLGLLAVGGYIGGYIGGKIYKSSGLIIGLVTGFIMFFIVLIAGLNSFSGSFSLLIVYKILVLLIFASLGAIIGVNKKEKIKFK
ncbi:MAG: TIGR04086 family membrane protein [Ruminococcus sp.]|nr:TIGR04086 family membrane protein [Ruminococcus sp.]